MGLGADSRTKFYAASDCKWIIQSSCPILLGHPYFTKSRLVSLSMEEYVENGNMGADECIQRKMMSLAMLACRTGSPASLISETYGSSLEFSPRHFHPFTTTLHSCLIIGPQRIHIPKAPPLGLLLEAPQFGLYNKRISSKPNGLESDHDPINWELYSKEKDAFKLKYIYDRLRKDELETHV